MKKRVLIICPVGQAITFDDRYDRENHWRFTKAADREYDTLIVKYKSDFDPEPDSYDYMTVMKDHKWKIVLRVYQQIQWIAKDYDYIGCVDDDLITDIHSFNRGIELAKQHDWPLWQLSMIEGSGIIYNCLKQNPDLVHSETNFIEMGSTFFRIDKFIRFMEFLNDVGHFKVGWGLDKVFCDVLNCSAHVVHDASIYHPPNTIKPSYYDQDDALREMNHMLYFVYPKIIKSKYNENWVFKDRQETLSVVRK